MARVWRDTGGGLLVEWPAGSGYAVWITGQVLDQVADELSPAVPMGDLSLAAWRELEELLPDDGRFDPVGLREISAMTGESTANLNYLMSSAPMSNGTVIQRPAGSPPPPRPVQLARMKVWRRSEVAVWWAAIGREVSWTDSPEGEGV